MKLLTIVPMEELGSCQLIQFDGKEGTSTSFFFHLIVAVEKSIDDSVLLGKKLCFSLNCSQGSRPLNGIIQSVEKINPVKGTSYSYRITLIPWMYVLSEHRDCRAFHNKSVLQIARYWFEYFGFSDFDFSLLKGSYPLIEYCVQFNESVFDFLSRLLAEYGIYYFFRFTKTGHTLVLADDVHAYQRTSTTLKIGEHADYFIKDYCFSFNPRPINVTINSSQSYPGQGELTYSKSSARQEWSNIAVEHQIYVNPVDKISKLEHDVVLYQRRLQAKEEILEFMTNLSSLSLCQRLRIDDKLDHGWIITHIEHHIVDDSCLLNTAADTSSTVVNRIFAIPEQTCCTPQLLSKPLFSGVHSATVIGPSANEVYTDSVGRVKIRMQWEHQNELLVESCWVRVVQPWADEGAGCDYTPRVGQEVLVKYENGDLDCPLVIGAVYNGENKPPYSKETEKKVSTITTLADVDSLLTNAIVFDHAPGQQKLMYEAAADLCHTVDGDLDITTHRHATTLVTKLSQEQVDKGKYQSLAKQKIIYKVGSNALIIHPEGIEMHADKVTINGQDTEAYKEVPLVGLNPSKTKPVHGSTVPSNAILQTIRVSPKWRKSLSYASESDLINLIRLPRGQLEFDAVSTIIDQFVPHDFSEMAGLSIPEKLGGWTSAIEDLAIREDVKKSLTLSAAEDCRDGYIYVFAKAKGGPSKLYSKVHLFKEYQVIHNVEFSRMGIYEIDLGVEAGKDDRTQLYLPMISGKGLENIDEGVNSIESELESDESIDSSKDDLDSAQPECTIELPFNYLLDDQGNEQGSFDVFVFFSDVQLSWPRIHKLGGMDPIDERIKTASLNAEQHKIIQEVASQKVDLKLQKSRFGTCLPVAIMTKIYRHQYKSKPSIKKVNLSGSANSSVWDKTTLFRVKDDYEYPWLLLDDPIGMLIKVNLMIDFLRRKLVSVVNLLSGDESIEMRTALLAYQLFFNLRINHIDEIQDSGSVEDSMSEEAREKAQGYNHVMEVREYLDKNKIQFYLQENKRAIIKKLIRYFQEQAVSIFAYLNKPQSPWGTELNQILIDRFAQKGHRYATGFNDLGGLFDLICLDPNDIDHQFDTDIVPPNKLVPDVQFISNYGMAPDSEYIAGYTETIYERHNFEVIEKVYCYDGDQLANKTSPQPVVSVFKKIPAPPGYAFLEQWFSSSIAKIILPDVSKKTPETESICHQFYLSGLGHYNPSELNQISTPDDIDSQTSDLDSVLILSPEQKPHKRLFKKSLKLVDSFLNSMANKVLKMREDYAKTAYLLRRMVVTINCDAYFISRQTIRIGGKPDIDNLVVSYALSSGRVRYNKFVKRQAEEAAAMPKDTVFLLTREQVSSPSGLSEDDKDFYTSDYGEVTKRIRRHEDEMIYQTDELLVKHVKDYTEVLSVDDFYTRGRSCISSAILMLAAYDFSSDCLRCARDLNWLSVMHLVLDINSLVSALCKTALRLEKDFKLVKKVNHYVDGHYQDILKKNPKLIPYCEVSLGALGVVSGFSSMITNYHSMISGFAKNDPVLSVSLSFGFASSAGFFITSSTRSIKRMSGRLATEGGEKVAGRSLMVEGVSLLGLTIPVLDVIDFLAWASLIVSSILSFFKRTDYQNWAANSLLAKKLRSDIDVDRSYMQLLSLLDRSSVTIESDDVDKTAFIRYKSIAAGMANKSQPVLNASLVIYDAHLEDPHFFMGNTHVLMPLNLARKNIYQAGIPLLCPSSQLTLILVGKGAYFDYRVSSRSLVNALVQYVALRICYGRCYESDTNDMMLIDYSADSLSSAVSDFLGGAEENYLSAFATTLFFDSKREKLLSIPMEPIDADHDQSKIVEQANSFGWNAAKCSLPKICDWGTFSSSLTEYGNDIKSRIIREVSQLYAQGQLKSVADKAKLNLSGILFVEDVYNPKLELFFNKTRFYDENKQN